MKTKVVKMLENNLNEEAIEEAAEVIKNGGLVAFPTETVYGLGANALNPQSVKKIFEAKGRPQDNPLIVHIADYDLQGYAKEVPDIVNKLINRFWPGPLTIILEKQDIIPDETSGGLSSIGLRMPNNNIALALIKKAGLPIAAPSANLSGKPSPTEVQRCIEDLDGRVDFIIGGSESEIGVESTVLDCTSYPPCILRPGAVTLEMLREVDEKIYIDPAIMETLGENIKPKAPGMKYRHYAPKASVKIIKGDLKKTIEKINEMVQNYKDGEIKVGILATEETKKFYLATEVISLGSREDLSSIAHNLFEALRALDDKNVDIILSEAFEEEGIGIAIMNRLNKAASFDIINV
ncbi:MAG: threonylcarbamoyl-AMP synthase [Clostridia bacterium]|jgi:L-threonylcarbamoyladenylate synthase|nr:threonylcarbamoyl-AMP synthase [Clostridia bacterium]